MPETETMLDMKSLRICRFLVVALAMAVMTAAPATAQDATTIFLVRHAEKIDDSRDPELSEAGHARAAALATALRHSGIEHVHSTDYIRTRDTAAPVAERLGLSVELYDPRALPAFAEQLRAAGGRHLVVGHSNTTPGMVSLLGGEAGSEIVEATEYDRLYIVTVMPGGKASTVLLRYGSP